ncbi:MAG: glycosyltransferase family 4 protein [Bacteroidota bacterium]|nr:glycosyltransferase family 4 protein [Bacteroidota bacterium]
MQENKNRIRIAYVTATDARNKHSWSGSDYYIWNALQKHVGDITLVRPKEPQSLIIILKILHGCSLYIFGKRFDWRHSTSLSKAYSGNLEKELEGKVFDLIVAPASDPLIANLNTPIPIVYINDRTIAGAIDYHKMLRNLWNFSKQQSILTDKTAIENSVFVSYPSKWAADSAEKLYGIPKEKIHLNHFGANMDVIPARSIAENRKTESICKLLFIGVNWNDKGGPIAFDCLKELIKMNINAELTVCGCIPSADVVHEKLNVIPFLNKNNPSEFTRLQELWSSSTFLILPTRIDAYGIVFCEASAYGLPSLGTDTGGVAGALHNEKNGYLMPFSAGGKDYALKIAAIYRDPEAYKTLSINARNEFEKELNWDVWAGRFKEKLKTTVPGIL